MRFKSDDQRKAVFAKLGGSRGSGGGRGHPIGGAVYGGITGAIWHAFPSQTHTAPTNPHTTVGSPTTGGGFNIPNPADYTFQPLGGVASFQDWQSAISNVQTPSWTQILFEGTLFDPTDPWAWPVEENPEIKTGEDAYKLAAQNAGIAPEDLPPFEEFTNSMGGTSTFYSQLKRWIWYSDGYDSEGLLD